MIRVEMEHFRNLSALDGGDILSQPVFLIPSSMVLNMADPLFSGNRYHRSAPIRSSCPAPSNPVSRVLMGFPALLVSDTRYERGSIFRLPNGQLNPGLGLCLCFLTTIYVQY